MKYILNRWGLVELLKSPHLLDEELQFPTMFTFVLCGRWVLINLKKSAAVVFSQRIFLN